jgi:hypothetical protein
MENESFNDAYEKKYPVSYVEWDKSYEFSADVETEFISEPLFNVMIIEKNTQLSKINKSNKHTS